jgi:para-aminobenzoate synthetase/4-amino-4-deoxychorismate lyase
LKQWTELPAQWQALVVERPGSVLLQTARYDAGNSRSLLFTDPIRTISVFELHDIPALFHEIDRALADGSHVAGYLGYECGYHFERFEDVGITGGTLPLAWFGVYRSPAIFHHATGFMDGTAGLPAMEPANVQTSGSFTDQQVNLAISESDYRAKIQRIKDYISTGDTYQVNFTDRVYLTTQTPADVAFRMLVSQQPVAYSAFLNVCGNHILSLSPELFFKIEEGRIVTRPMKGTMPRGLDSREDTEAALRLESDEKNRSEHVMIVDLLRSDLGRICTMGSVQVEDIFSVEKYATLLQMTSTVAGILRKELSYYDIFKSVFPSGSITGAPKIRTMQIIRELERAPRGIYTGAIGYIAPTGDAAFNVAIRTLVLKDGEAQMGVGGGIVADSDPSEEYRECMLKTGFLTRRRNDFQLIETMLWEGEFSLLVMHMERLESSAEYFNFCFNRDAIVAQLSKAERSFLPEHRYRVRLLLDASGEISLASTEYVIHQSSGTARLSVERTSSKDVFLRHKTTNRRLYESEYAEARAAGFDEVIFMNEGEEITVGAISNIFIQRDGKLLTPPLSSGVLPGIYRRHVLETNVNAEEKKLQIEDLKSADAVFLCNSLREMRKLKSILLGDGTSAFFVG